MNFIHDRRMFLKIHFDSTEVRRDAHARGWRKRGEKYA